MRANRIYISVALVAGILIVLNLLADKFSLRLDLTEDKRYTLSEATRNILKDLPEPVTVKAYFSENLPPHIVQTKKDFKEMLVEYASLSGGMLVYEFIDPGKEETTEQEALQNGIQPLMINVREKDQIKQQKAFMGALIELGEQKEAIPFMQPGTAMEYALSTSIKKLAVVDKPSIALIQGHGEPSLREMQQAYVSLSILYNVEPYTFQDTVPIPERFRTVALVAPKDSIPQSDFIKLDQFLSRGGNLFIALNRVSGDFSNASGSTLNTGLESWLSSKGIQVEDHFVVDANCGAVTVQQQQGFFRIANNVSFPYLPIVNKFADHPLTKGLESVMLQFASPVTYVGDSSKVFTPLLMSSEQSGSMKVPLYFDIQKQWTENDFPMSHITLGGVLEGAISGTTPSKMVVIGDGDFAVNGSGAQAQNLQADNVSLLVNGIDWLSDDTGLIDLRTRGVSSRPIDQLEDSTKTILKYLNFLLPILLIIIYGLIRMQLKRTVKNRRMRESYAR